MTSGESFERGALLGASRRFAGPLLVAVALFFRLPLLLQPFFTSDAAITGLQGLHMLRGEFSRWLWERPYQSSLEPAIAAVFEKLLGANLLAIAAGPVLEELLVCWLLHRLLSRYVGDWPAAIACLPVALPVMPLIAPVIFGTRALVGLVAISAVVLADRAESIAGFSLAAAALVFCLFLDLYALQLVPPLLLLIVLPAHKRGRLAAVIAGAAAAAAAVAALRIGADSSILGQGLHLPFNAKLALLFRVCLPVALGSYWHRLDATAMNGGGLPGEGLRILGAVALLAGIASGALLWFRRSLPLAVRRMGLCGALAAAGSVAAFLVSGLSQDLWSSRYLVAALWAAPPGATAGQSGGGAAPPSSATLEECVTSVVQAERSATFAGEMSAIAGTARMAMRIEVQERIPGEASFHTVAAPGLGVWRGSDPRVKIYKYLKQVTNLSSPAVYRALVRFRWEGPRGHVLRRAEHATAGCDEPAAPPAPAATGA